MISPGIDLWSSISVARNGQNLIASVYGGLLYMSTNQGFSWYNQTSLGAKKWTSVASSVDGTKKVAVAEGDNVYIYQVTAPQPVRRQLAANAR